MARVPYASRDDLDPEYRNLIVSSLQPGKRLNVYSAVGSNPAVLDGLRAFLSSLWTESGLSDRSREILILTVAAETGSNYEWHQHVNIATDVGLTREEITAIAADDPEPFSPGELALMEYARAVMAGYVTDEAHAAVAEQYGDEGVVGAAGIVGGYFMLARLIDALGVELEDGEEFVGWSPSE